MYKKKHRDHSIRFACTKDGEIKTLIHDGNQFFKPDAALPGINDIMPASSLSVYQGFIKEALEYGFSLCEGVMLRNDDGEYGFSLFGVFRSGHIYVVAIQSPQHLFQIYGDFMQMINEQARELRVAQKESATLKAASRIDHKKVLEDYMQVNNDFADMQRVLSKQNRELEQAYADIEEKNRLLQEMSRTDPLTGVANRRHLFERLEAEVSRAQRYGTPLAIAMLDIDHFKDVNDDFGHQAGDAVLAAVASRMTDMARDVDVVGRYGGEEFLVIMPDTQVEGGLVFAERILAAIQEIEVKGVERRITASLGVASFEQGAAEDLIAVADARLYSAKEAGRNRVHAE